MGTDIARIIDNYWKRQRIVPKVGECLVTYFGTRRVVTQGDPISPMILNIVVYVVVYMVMEEVCISQEAQHRMGWAAGERNLLFYVDDRIIAGWYCEWVKDTLTVTVTMF